MFFAKQFPDFYLKNKPKKKENLNNGYYRKAI